MLQNKNGRQADDTLGTADDGTLASLGRGPPESDTNKCSLKYLIVKVDIPLALDCTLDIQLLNYTGWRFILLIVQVIDRTRSTPTTYSVVECYYLGNREAQAQPRATKRRNKESSRCERDGIRGRRQGVSESALPRTLRRTRWEK
ncbi:unnamed protein product [Euphydryas editha]|uniref:Uncharacterized protein n=1 Tax=Euphydryas editha TaxID=104508 RepID=A0AAU9V6Y2_EUPED|nr:unnamed protein product [Euphydryas editha]